MLHSMENITDLLSPKHAKYMRYNTESIRCTTQKIYAAQHGRYRLLHKMENIRSEYTSHQGGQNTGGSLLEFNMRGPICTENLMFRLQYLCAIINKISKLVSR